MTVNTPTTMSKIDTAFEKFLEYKKQFNDFLKEDLSETDTRCKILDVILNDVLGWDEYDIIREGYVRTGYFDYEVSSATFKFVIEAKKGFVDFKLPAKGNESKLKTLYTSNKDVFNQIRGYLFERGLAYGVCTNGHQFIIGRFVNNTGIDWQENKCFYFKDLDDIESNFIKFYGLFSKENIQLSGRIVIDEEDNTGQTIFKNCDLKRKDDELIRNQLSYELIPIINKVFEEIYLTENLEKKEILEKCYVSNEDVKKYKKELGHIFSDEPPTFDARIVPVKNTQNTQEQIEKQIFASSEAPDPIIIIGTAGCGKTTFIKYFLDIVLTDSDKKKRPTVYIDFRSFTSQNIKDTRYIHKIIITELNEKFQDLKLDKFNVLKTIYKKEIKAKTDGIWSHLTHDEPELQKKIAAFIEENINDAVVHLKKIAEYLINQCDKKLCVVFDNADQLEEDDQREVFLLANTINKNLKSIVLVSLREGYFYKWKNKPPFNAYHSIVYHIAAPRYKEVLKKRIDYVMTSYSFKEMTLEFQNKKVSFGKGSLTHLFKNLYDSLFKKENSEILSFLEETSYPNIREGLEKFKSFLLSGHTKITEYMSFEYGKGEGIPIWEFFKAVALSSKYYYSSDKSCIKNIFYPSKNNSNHFTKIRLLTYLLDKCCPEGKTRTFLSITDCFTTFIKAGYSREVILDELQELLDANLITTSDFSNDIDTDIKLTDLSKLTVSPVGNYYINTLYFKFHYLDLVLQDTPIFDRKFFTDLVNDFPETDEYGNRPLDMRLKSVKTFVKYLESQERIDHLRNEISYNIKALDVNLMQMLKQKIQKDFTRLEKIIQQP